MTARAATELMRLSGSSFRVVAMNMTFPGCARKKSKLPVRMLRLISKILLQKKPIRSRWIRIDVPTSSIISHLFQPAMLSV